MQQDLDISSSVHRTRLGRISLLIVFCLAACSGTSNEVVEPQPKGTAWETIGPGGGGSTFIPTFDPSDPETVLIRCDMSGAYLSRDGGQSWKLLNFPGGAQAFAIDPSDSSRLYVGAAGLHGSTDGGKTWKLLFPDPDSVSEVRNINDHASTYYVSEDNFPVGAGSIRSILVDPSESSHLVVGINSRSPEGPIFGVYSSNDEGRSWNLTVRMEHPILRFVSQPEDLSRAFIFTRNSYAVLDLESDQLEAQEEALEAQVTPVSWVDAGLDPELNRVRLWAIRRTSRQGGDPGSVFTSSDFGQSWDKVNPVPPSESEKMENPRSASFNHIATSHQNGRTAYLVCDRAFERNARGQLGLWYGILRTDDAGKNWRWVYRAGGGSPDYTVRDGWKAENVNDSWVREAFAGEFIAMLNVEVFPQDPDIAIFTDWYRVMKTVDGGDSWNALYSETLPDSSIRSRGLDVTTTYGVHFDPFDPDHLVISYTDIGYHHSFDRGRTWHRSIEGVPPEWDNTCYWVQFDPETEGKLWSVWSSWHDIPKLKMIRDPRWRLRAVGGVCLSIDGGRQWTVSSDGLPANSPTTGLALDPNSAVGQRTLYAAVYGQGVFKSTDDGKTWAQKNSGLGVNLNAWEITLSKDGALYVVITHNTQFVGDEALPDLLDGRVYRSSDGAESWQRVDLPEKARFPNSISIDPNNPSRLYLACWASMMKGDFGRFEDSRTLLEAEGGLFVSEDTGETWVSTFDPSAYVYAATPDHRHPGRVYLVTFHNNAYRSDDYGRSWRRIEGYDFLWGHRPVIDVNDPEAIHNTTFGGSVFHGYP